MSANLISQLKPMTDGVVPITAEERISRVEKAKELMRENNLDAVYLEAGSSLFYFTGIEWGQSERMTAAVIPAEGDIAYVCPAFEEARLREMLIIGDDVRVWEENENPFKLVSGILEDRGVTGRVGMEESVRFFLLDGIRREARRLDYVSADPVIAPCRASKSPAEIDLIQQAMNITAEVFKVCISMLQEGMSQEDFRAVGEAARKALGGGPGFLDVQFGHSTAFPHGSKELTFLKDGDVVLMDGGCTLEGYYADISRTIVFGRPTGRQRNVWEVEKEAQAAAFKAACLDAPCEAVDAAARKVITDAGFGPGYKVPGLPHRTGHGIGLDVHERPYIVQGNRTPLAPGMCFSNEPMIAIYGEFGIRLEDCIHMTEDGPQFFTQPSPSIEQPFA
jgi:Xaa-Pro dipeptidase